jgi:hypothetical protein
MCHIRLPLSRGPHGLCGDLEKSEKQKLKDFAEKLFL